MTQYNLDGPDQYGLELYQSFEMPRTPPGDYDPRKLAWWQKVILYADLPRRYVAHYVGEALDWASQQDWGPGFAGGLSEEPGLVVVAP